MELKQNAQLAASEFQKTLPTSSSAGSPAIATKTLATRQFALETHSKEVFTP
jgi:hypothetical protein